MVVVRVREDKKIVSPVNNKKEGRDLIRLYEADDFIAGCYTPDFYEVAEVDDEDSSREA